MNERNGWILFFTVLTISLTTVLVLMTDSVMTPVSVHPSGRMNDCPNRSRFKKARFVIIILSLYRNNDHIYSMTLDLRLHIVFQ